MQHWITYETEIEGKKYLCHKLRAFYSLQMLDQMKAIFPMEDMAFLSAEGRSILRSHKMGEEFIKARGGKLDPDGFLRELFYRSNLTQNGEPITDINAQFESLAEVFEVVSWICELSYMEALAIPALEIPNEIKNADKMIATKKIAEASLSGGSQPTETPTKVSGIMPNDVPHWVFLAVSLSDKNKRCDWQLLHQLKTEMDLVDFMHVWLCIQSAQTFETSATLAALT